MGQMIMLMVTNMIFGITSMLCFVCFVCIKTFNQINFNALTMKRFHMKREMAPIYLMLFLLESSKYCIVCVLCALLICFPESKKYLCLKKIYRNNY